MTIEKEVLVRIDCLRIFGQDKKAIFLTYQIPDKEGLTIFL